MSVPTNYSSKTIAVLQTPGSFGLFMYHDQAMFTECQIKARIGQADAKKMPIDVEKQWNWDEEIIMR